MVETITEVTEEVTEAVANSVSQGVHTNGDRVAIDGEYSIDGQSADAEAFFSAVRCAMHEDVGEVAVGGLTLNVQGERRGGEIVIYRAHGSRVCFVDTLTELENVAQEHGLL